MSDEQTPPTERRQSRRRQNTLLAAVLALLLTALLLIDFDPSSPLRETPEDVELLPDAYLVDMETRDFNALGQPQYLVRADSALYYAGDNNLRGGYTTFSTPLLTFRSDDAAPWQLRADIGRSDTQGETITLISDVRLWQGTRDTTFAELSTDELLIKLSSRYAETEKAVTMRSEQSRTTAVGMRAFLDEEVIELLSEVESTYDP